MRKNFVADWAIQALRLLTLIVTSVTCACYLDASALQHSVMQSREGSNPGQEVALTDKCHHTCTHSCLVDGRIFVGGARPDR